MKREVRLFDELDKFAQGAEISHALALSFGYDGDVANERLWTPLIEKYGLRHPLVIAGGVVLAGTALGVHVLKAPRLAGVFHPKLFLAVREDAVFAAIGSANLTRGGLGANLELVTALVFEKDTEGSPPRTVLEEILGFVRRIIADLQGRIAESSRGKAIEVVHHAQLVLQTLPEMRRGPELRFLHSYEEPLWNQLRRTHGDDTVEHLMVVSPFFEVDDPELDESNSLLRYALHDGLPWSARAKAPRCTLHSCALGDFMPLPRAAIEELGPAVEVRPQALSVEPRRLHGKLIAIFGRKRTTLLWGSPNFTPSALLRTAAASGNVECALAFSVGVASVDTEAVMDEFDLGEIFHAHRGALPEASISPPRPPPVIDVGEVLYDPALRRLSIFGDVWSPEVRSIRVLLAVKGESPALLIDGEVVRTGTFCIEADTDQIEEEDPDTGKRRLRSLLVWVEAIDAAGAPLDRRETRINIRFDDALEVHQNLLLGTAALTADALLVPSSAPPEQRIAALNAYIEELKAVRRGDGVITAQHQASLDAFFRNVRLGLDGQWDGLVRRKGSRFALLRWSHALRRSLSAAGAGSLEASRQVYLTARVAEHIERVLDAIPRWHSDPAAAYDVIEAEKLAEVLAAVSMAAGVRQQVLDETCALRGRVLEALKRVALDMPVASARPPERDRVKGRERRGE